jgi:hydrogenase maturation protease
MSHMTTALIALGNEFRRDDGIASALCRALPQEVRDSFTYFELGIHGEQIMNCLKSAKRAIVVDALLAPESVGSLVVCEGGDLRVGDLQTLRATHGLSWFHELALNKPEIPITFIGVPVADAGWGEGFSPKLQAQKAHLCDELALVCRAVLRGSNHA